MLKHLEISNYALISHTAVDFDKGFTVITGETGAGKSILLEALGLVLGSRANFNAIRKGQDKCVIEATFTYDNPALDHLLERESLDPMDDVILRRELTTSGRSRAFVNDSPVTIAVLREVAVYLVDLHGQQENISLQTAAYQVKQLDQFARNQKTFNAYTEAYKAFQSVDRKLTQLRDAAAQVHKDEDYFRFQFEELQEAALEDHDFAAMEEELNALEHAEEIQQALSVVDQGMEGEAEGVLSMLRSMAQALRSVAGFSKSVEELHERMQSTMIELEDIRSECARVATTVEHEPGRLEVIREQMDQLQRLMHKHGVQTIDELIAVREEYRIKLDGIASYEDELHELEEKRSKAEEALHSKASALTDSRSNAVELYVKKLTEQVHKLGMPKAKIEVRLQPLDTPGTLGQESVEMWFDANGSKHLVPLKESASGGEVSRLMLALKSILAESDRTPTLIFDEIDTGVSGEIAKQIGTLMRAISQHTQIIAVTHLPGVAAKGSAHLQIAKSEKEGEVVSSLRELAPEERVEEIAGMFSGRDLSDASRESARNLLDEH